MFMGGWVCVCVYVATTPKPSLSCSLTIACARRCALTIQVGACIVVLLFSNKRDELFQFTAGSHLECGGWAVGGTAVKATGCEDIPLW